MDELYCTRSVSENWKNFRVRTSIHLVQSSGIDPCMSFNGPMRFIRDVGDDASSNRVVNVSPNGVSWVVRGKEEVRGFTCKGRTSVVWTQTIGFKRPYRGRSAKLEAVREEKGFVEIPKKSTTASN